MPAAVKSVPQEKRLTSCPQPLRKARRTRLAGCLSAFSRTLDAVPVLASCRSGEKTAFVHPLAKTRHTTRHFLIRRTTSRKEPDVASGRESRRTRGSSLTHHRRARRPSIRIVQNGELAGMNMKFRCTVLTRSPIPELKTCSLMVRERMNDFGIPETMTGFLPPTLPTTQRETTVSIAQIGGTHLEGIRSEFLAVAVPGRRGSSVSELHVEYNVPAAAWDEKSLGSTWRCDWRLSRRRCTLSFQ